jgi:hypothetical protein
MPPVALSIQPRQFLLLWFVCLGWVLLVAAASAIFRVRKGRYIFRPPFPNAVFCETWASGRSHRSLLTRLVGANRCLWVAVTPDELLVGLHFPFSLFFLPESYGLEYRASGSEIASVELRQSMFGRSGQWSTSAPETPGVPRRSSWT